MNDDKKQKAGRAWDWAWLAWLVAFLCIEIPAMRFKGATLSEHAWSWFSFLTHERHWLARRIIGGAFFFALCFLHFILGWRAWPWLIIPSVPFGLVIVYSVVLKGRQKQ